MDTWNLKVVRVLLADFSCPSHIKTPCPLPVPWEVVLMWQYGESCGREWRIMKSNSVSLLRRRPEPSPQEAPPHSPFPLSDQMKPSYSLCSRNSTRILPACSCVLQSLHETKMQEVRMMKLLVNHWIICLVDGMGIGVINALGVLSPWSYG